MSDTQENTDTIDTETIGTSPILTQWSFKIQREFKALFSTIIFIRTVQIFFFNFVVNFAIECVI